MTTPTRAEIIERWCGDLPSLAVSSVAGALGRTFGDVALAIGDLDLALTWARALAPFAFPSRASALAAIAERLYCTRHAARIGGLVSEAIDAIHFEGDAIEILTLHGGTLAWEVEDALVALVSTDDELAFAAVQWMYHARIGEPGADRAPRQQVLAAAPRLADAILAVQRAVIAAAFSTDDVDLIADHVSIVATRDLVEAHVRAGNITAALATRPTTAHWLFSYLARTRRDDPRAEQWAAHARRIAAQLTEHFEEGLLTSMEAFEGRLEAIALRAAEDPRGAREALMEVVHEEVSYGRECMDDARQLCVDIGSGVHSPGLEAEPKWRTARGERQLARALEAWRLARLESCVRGAHHARTIFRAATSFALDGDLRRARELIERGLAGEPALVSRIEPVQSALVRAWIATDQVQQAVELAFATRLSVAALAMLAVELATTGKPDIALQLLESGLGRVRSSSELVLLARGVLAIANDRDAARMLVALDEADRALDAVLRW